MSELECLRTENADLRQQLAAAQAQQLHVQRIGAALLNRMGTYAVTHPDIVELSDIAGEFREAIVDVSYAALDAALTAARREGLERAAKHLNAASMHWICAKEDVIVTKEVKELLAWVLQQEADFIRALPQEEETRDGRVG